MKQLISLISVALLVQSVNAKTVTPYAEGKNSNLKCYDRAVKFSKKLILKDAQVKAVKSKDGKLYELTILNPTNQEVEKVEILFDPDTCYADIKNGQNDPEFIDNFNQGQEGNFDKLFAKCDEQLEKQTTKIEWTEITSMFRYGNDLSYTERDGSTKVLDLSSCKFKKIDPNLKCEKRIRTLFDDTLGKKTKITSISSKDGKIYTVETSDKIFGDEARQIEVNPTNCNIALNVGFNAAYALDSINRGLVDSMLVENFEKCAKLHGLSTKHYDFLSTEDGTNVIVSVARYDENTLERKIKIDLKTCNYSTVRAEREKSTDINSAPQNTLSTSPTITK